MKIKSCLPPKALPGGVVRVELSGVKDPGALEARLGQISADILGASQSFLTVRIPEEGAGDLTIISEGREHVVPVVLGNALVDDLHPVGRGSPVRRVRGTPRRNETSVFGRYH